MRNKWIEVMFIGAAIVACETTKEFKVTKNSIAPGEKMTWVGKDTRLKGAGKVAIGSPLPEAALTSTNGEAVVVSGAGKVKVLITVPSIDTPVCEQQTHILSETTTLDPAVERIAVSVDLPYASRRFLEESKLQNVAFLSDYRSREFGEKTGLIIERNDLLGRSVMVIDKKGIVRHLQIVPEITEMPDMGEAFDVANRLVKE
jgi:thioredoxin-dependent peroxiredoxin